MGSPLPDLPTLVDSLGDLVVEGDQSGGKALESGSLNALVPVDEESCRDPSTNVPVILDHSNLLLDGVGELVAGAIELALVEHHVPLPETSSIGVLHEAEKPS